MSKKSLKNKAAALPPDRGLVLNSTMTAVFGVLFFFLTVLAGSFDTVMEKCVAFLSCLALLLLCCFTQTARFRRFLTPTAFTLSLYTLVGGVSTLYAVAGKFAISEFSKMLAAFVLFALIVGILAPGAEQARRLLTALAAVCAVFSLISIDAASAEFFTRGFRAVVGVFTQAYAEAGAVADGSRISSIFNTPNIFGGIAGLGLLFSVYLTATATRRREKIYQTVFLAVTALAFLYTFSMGATLCLAVSAVVMLLAAAPPDRIRFFVVMLETALAGLAVMYFSFGYLGTAGPQAWLPILAAAVLCAVLLLAERFAGGPLSALLSKNPRRSLVFAAAVAAVLLVVLALAAALSGPATLAPGETLRRAAYPAPGAHTLAVTADAPLHVTIAAQNMEQVMMHKQTVLYEGPITESADFTVPEDSRVVWFDFRADGSATLTAAGYGNNALKLRYTLLPASIANRLQGLMANQNAIQRFVFFYDGLKIFARSPLIGLGLGGYQNAIFSAQDFYYTTKYAHNHYIQVLAEMGLLGFIPYLAFLLCAARALWRSRRVEGPSALTAALAAGFVMVATHSAVEVVMSATAFLTYAFVLFALITLQCDQPAALPAPAAREASRPAGGARPMRVGLAVFASLFIILLLGNFIARGILADAIARAQNGGEAGMARFFPAMTTAAGIDVFEKNDYLLAYVTSAPQMRNSDLLAQADIYAERLSKAKSNTIQGQLTVYYFTVGQPAKAFEMSRQILTYRRADPAIWSQQFTVFAGFFESITAGGAMTREVYAASVRSVYDLLLEANETRMESIALTEDNIRFLQELGII
ncbi:MAG: O-antigen ligase family protein [Gracilibacteraceae bacterium]|nr:O-antigen ligase family protein [Gracilibacteraceae bacterium]